jgi:hypothetical protein
MRVSIGCACVVLSGLSCAASGQCAFVPPVLGGDDFGAGFGIACAMDAAGTVALVSGSGYDGGDGLVRTFRRVGGDWVEGPAFGALFGFGDNFGAELAMSDDGLTAVVCAPREPSFTPSFHLAAGGAYIYERAEGTGDWTQSHRFAPPEPGTEENFGAACAISADGSVVVIGEANVLGSKWVGLPDAAWVSTRQGGTWGPLVRLVPSPAPPDSYNFGQSVAISADGTLIAVGAPTPPAFSGESGIVHVFELQGSSWVQTDVLSRPIAGDSFNGFGGFLAFDGTTLLTHNRSETGPGVDGVAPVCLYERSGGAYPAVPSELLIPPAAAPTLGPMVVRNDTLLLCTLAQGVDDGLSVYRRDTDSPTRTWSFDGIFASDDPDPFGGSTGYGRSAAIADDPSVMVVGEPGWSSDPFTFSQEGRINFPDRVFTNDEFVITPGSSTISVTFEFPGMFPQSLFLELLGFFDLGYPVNCDGSDTPVQVVIEGMSFSPADPEVVIEGPLGVPIRLTDVVISLAGPSDPAPVGPFGDAAFTGMVVAVDATVKIGILPSFPFSAEGAQSEPMNAYVFGSMFGMPPRFQVPSLGLDFEPDLGLGDNNPTVTAIGSIFTERDTSCAADLAEPFGVLNFFDVAAFIGLYNAQDPGADLAEPFGVLNFFDVAAYIGAYNAGCP